MKLYCKISCEPNKTFNILPDATFSYCANEELDSANIILTHLREQIANLKPYDWCQIYDENNNKVGNRFLIDSFQCKEINIKQHIYQYTIALMSETKLLEKVQLPNRQWLAKIDGSKRKLYDAIDQLMRIYSPKVKVTDNNKFKYDYLIKWDYSALQEKFNVDLKDLSLSQPTLRQALTAMMIQVGCLPTVENGELSWLDLRQEPSNFVVNDTMNYFETSMASDSYVNSLVSQGDNILDTKNECVNEILHFTDKENALLKQTENLFLETSKPIYYVNNLTMCLFGRANILITGLPHIYTESTNRTFEFSYKEDGTTSSEAKFTVFNKLMRAVTVELIFIFYSDTDGRLKTSRKTETFNISLTGEEYSVAIPYGYNKCYAIVKMRDGLYLSSLSPKFKINLLFKSDITKLCVEQGRRQYLNADYLEMAKESGHKWTVDELSEYVYGTVGYKKGDKKIEGFSSTYSAINGWFESLTGGRTYTYIENILRTVQMSNKDFANFIYPTKLSLNEILFNNEEVIGNEQAIQLEIETIYNTKGTQTLNFSSVWFEISYQPLNSLNIKFNKKEEATFEIEQLDNAQNALENLDDLALSEMDKVSRLGQEIMSINQLTLNKNDIQSIPSKFRDYTVFKKVVSYGLNSISVNYFASKNYIMKNYFTSIATKYRATAYSDYEEAIVRKENTKVYALLSKDYNYYGSDSVVFGNLINPTRNTSDLLSMFSKDIKNVLSYGYEYGNFNNDQLGTFKIELSISSYENNVILNYQQLDNVSPGIAINNREAYFVSSPSLLGGLPQSWYVWDNPEYDRKYVGFISRFENLGENIETMTQDEIKEEVKKVASSPLTNVFGIPVPYTNKINTIITLTDRFDNDNEEIYLNGNNAKFYFKDQSEIINQTLQFEYYSIDAKLGRLFADMICWKNPFSTTELWSNNEIYKVFNYQGRTWRLVVEPSWTDFNDEIHKRTNFTYVEVENAFTVVGNSLKINYKPTDATKVKLVLIDRTEEYAIDICELNFKNGDTYYLTLNDTKTNKVYDMNGDIPYLTYEVETGNNIRNSIKHI